MRGRLASSVVLLAMALSGCLADPADDADGDDPVGVVTGAASTPGNWMLPADVAAAGAPIVRYDDSPPWDGGAHCSGTFTEGAMELRAYILETYPGVSEIYGYSCRQNTANAAQTSMHGTGRAIDVMVPEVGGLADNDVGDPIGNWLVSNSERIGIQYIIWDRTSWNGSRTSGDKTREYTGPNPHTDHLHVELNLDAAARTTPWFTEPDPPPPTPPPPPPPPPTPPPPPPTPPPGTPPPPPPTPTPPPPPAPPPPSDPGFDPDAPAVGDFPGVRVNAPPPGLEAPATGSVEGGCSAARGDGDGNGTWMAMGVVCASAWVAARRRRARRSAAKAPRK